MPDLFAGLPCNDADVAFYDEGDFPALAPRASRMARGEDGVIPAGSFALTSAFPFEARGVQVGHVLLIAGYKDAAGKPVAASDMLPVVSVAGSTVTLGRYEVPGGMGDFPAGVTLTAGVTGVKFLIPTVLARIGKEYEEVKRDLGIPAAADVSDSDDVFALTVEKVLRDLYTTQWRTAKDDVWDAKRKNAEARIASLLAGLRVTYGDETPQGHRPVAGAPADDPCWVTPFSPRPLPYRGAPPCPPGW